MGKAANVERRGSFSNKAPLELKNYKVKNRRAIAFLNEYFALMVECIAREAGMLDKFIGDAIMAAFGLPISPDDDEDRAVRAAIAMLRESNSGQWRWESA